MARDNSDPIDAAIEATDKEMFAEALKADVPVHDDTGDRGLEQQGDGLEGRMGGDDIDAETEVEAEEGKEAATEDGEAETEAEAKPDEADKGPAKDPKTGKFVKADAKDEKPADKEPGRIPPARLREESEKRRALETERDAFKTQLEAERQERAALNTKFDLVLRQLELRAPQPAKTEEPKPDPRPDVFVDPEGFYAWNDRQVEARVATTRQELLERLNQFERQRVEDSLELARETHKEKFDAAWQSMLREAEATPEGKLTAQRLYHSRNPGAELMRWHLNRETLREVGPDPQAYVNKKVEEALAAKLEDPAFLKTVIEKHRATAAAPNGNGAVRHVTRAPVPLKSLNAASGTSQLSDSTLQTILDDSSDEGFFHRAVADR